MAFKTGGLVQSEEYEMHYIKALPEGLTAVACLESVQYKYDKDELHLLEPHSGEAGVVVFSCADCCNTELRWPAISPSCYTPLHNHSVPSQLHSSLFKVASRNHHFFTIWWNSQKD